MRPALASLALLLLLALAGRAAATTVTWESGNLSGTVGLGPVYVGNPATVSGGLTINAGDDDVPGLDYSSAGPGSLDLLVYPFTLVWSGTFSGPSGSPLLTLRVNAGTFTTSVIGLNIMVGDVFDLTGPLATLDVLAPLPPFPSHLADPFVAAHVTVTQVYFFGGPVAFDFTGTYEARATQSAVVPEPASLALLAVGASGAALLRKRHDRF
jgi:hypothetical protein